MTGGQKPDGKFVDMMDKAWKEMTSIIGILEEDPGAKTEAVKTQMKTQRPLNPLSRSVRKHGKPRISRKQMPSVTNLPKRHSSGRYASRRAVEKTVRFETYKRCGTTPLPSVTDRCRTWILI